MSFIHNHSLLIIGLLLVLLLIAISIIIKQMFFPKEESCNSSRGSVSKEKFNEVFRKWEDLQDQLEVLQEKYDIVCSENRKLENKIDELKRENNELNTFYEKSLAHIDQNKARKGEWTTAWSNQEEKDSPRKFETQVTMYASFPRSAGNSIYFSDLTDYLADDSYFELRISNEMGKASFKPLDFMKIRNYDPAMLAMVTEGVKPNVASTVLGIESGKAHVEGKDWIIDNPAKIKLA